MTDNNRQFMIRGGHGFAYGPTREQAIITWARYAISPDKHEAFEVHDDAKIDEFGTVTSSRIEKIGSITLSEAVLAADRHITASLKLLEWVSNQLPDRLAHRMGSALEQIESGWYTIDDIVAEHFQDDGNADTTLGLE